jgi:hypothetical protein
MQNYIKLLIDDIHKATFRLRPPSDTWLETEADPDNEAELEDLSFIEKHFDGKEEPISQITGIDTKQIPPVEKLTIEQQATLAIELEKLLIHFNFKLLFPENYPPHLKYPFIKEFWEEEHVALSFGMNEIEFCDMNDEIYCPFEGYCKICEEVRAQMKYDEECEQRIHIDNDDDDLPDWVKNADHKTSDRPDNLDINNILPTKEEIETFVKQQEGTDIDDESYTIFYSKDEQSFMMLDKDGNKIKPDTIPLPSLCTICKKHQHEEFDEDILCIVKRYEQKDSVNFRCNMFKRI